MDNYGRKNRFSDYFKIIADVESQSLMNVANRAAQNHLMEGMNRAHFIEEVRSFIDTQRRTIHSATTEADCQVCIQNLKQERAYLDRQDNMLRTGEASLHASVEFIQQGSAWGYIINGVGIVLSGFQVVAGFGVMAVSFATGNVVGVGFGALLTLHGFNGLQESATNIFRGKNSTDGLLKKGYIAGAEFLGFDRKIGELAYSSMDLLLSGYGMVRLITKPQTFRLFHYMSTDYVRGIKEMSRLELGVEMYNDSMAIKSIYDSIKAR